MLWYILIGVFAFAFLLLLIPLSLTVMLDEQGNTQLRGRVLGICVYRSPKKERPIKLSEYSPRALKRKQKKARHAHIKALQKQQKKAAKQQKKNRSPSSTTLNTKLSLTEQISLIRDLAQTVLRRSLHHARVDVERLTITVATPDAAKTGILYGAVCSALAFLTETLHNFSHLHIRHPDRYGVTADFVGDKCRADIRLHFRLRVHHVLHIAMHTLTRLISRNLKKQKR